MKLNLPPPPPTHLPSALPPLLPASRRLTTLPVRSLTRNSIVRVLAWFTKRGGENDRNHSTHSYVSIKLTTGLRAWRRQSYWKLFYWLLRGLQTAFTGYSLSGAEQTQHSTAPHAIGLQRLHPRSRQSSSGHRKFKVSHKLQTREETDI